MRGRFVLIGLLTVVAAAGGCAGRTPTIPSTSNSPTAAACAYAPDGTAATVDAAGGVAAAAVKTAPGCRWTAGTGSNTDAWIAIDNADTRLGPGVVAFTLQPNRSFTGRSGAIAIRNERGELLATHAVTQRAAGCLYSVSPETKSLPSSGTYGAAEDEPVRVNVHAEPSDCQWTATPSVPWIRLIYETPRGTGDKTLYLSVTASNQQPVARIGDVVIAGLSGVNPDAHLLVSQAAR